MKYKIRPAKTDCQSSLKKKLRTSLALCVLRKWNLQLKALPQRKTLGPNGFTGEFYSLVWKK